VSAPAALTVSDLSFRYPGRDRHVLAGLSFEAPAGSALGVLGANGSGKSTLLAALAGARAGLRTGTVTLSGAARSDLTQPDPRAIGFATQDVALYRELTVRENLRHAARVTMRRDRVAAAVDRAIAEYGLAPVVDVAAHRLSGGWARVAHLAATFVHDPPVRLLDEPTAALDFEARVRLVALIRSWRDSGVICVVTSHYPEDIEEMCEAVVVIAGGAVVYRGTVADLAATTAVQPTEPAVPRPRSLRAALTDDPRLTELLDVRS
jgi:ABC-2 type transport system ATP-binding protein